MLTVRALSRPGLPTVSFDLDDGECIAVRGVSGSGKTLLLRAIADLDPNFGTVALDGRSREAMPAPHWRRLVTYVSSEPGWWADTVGAHFIDWPVAQPLIEAVGLPMGCRDWAVPRLSTGERQRLGLVRALVLRPKVLLLDEPTSGLDRDTVVSVERLIADHLSRGASAAWVTHDAAQARRVARRCLWIDRDGATEPTP